MELSLMIIFWYGMLHAFGPDHLTVIADFSIGKNSLKTLSITLLFALGHGISLFIFAKILQSVAISSEILAYGDMISAVVIILMGVYLLYMVISDQIQLKKHIHDDKEHIHIWFGKAHDHNSVDSISTFSLGILMGIGGIRGMLVTLGVVQGSVDLTLVAVFTLGVMSVFVLFGLFMRYINKNLLNNKKSVRRAFATAGVISLVVGTNILLG
jgi:ABC-type nickel/cobalt efflux system permease component RcnA